MVENSIDFECMTSFAYNPVTKGKVCKVFLKGAAMAPRLQTVTKQTLCKWGHFDKAKLTFKMLLASWAFDTLLKRIRYFFSDKNLGSLGQRAAKLLAIKLWEWFHSGRSRIRADWFKRDRGRAEDFFLRPPTLTVINFEKT